MHRNGIVYGVAALVAAAIVVGSPLPAGAQSGSATRPAAIDAMVALPATGEQIQLVGTATVDASVAALDGAHYRMSYTCDIAGNGRTATPGADYQLVGHTSNAVVFDGPLPATVSAMCSADLTGSATPQRYDIAVEVTVLADASVGSAAVRQVVATR